MKQKHNYIYNNFLIAIKDLKLLTMEKAELVCQFTIERLEKQNAIINGYEICGKVSPKYIREKRKQGKTYKFNKKLTGNFSCIKPKPGMVYSILKKENLPSNTKIYFIGDRASDVKTGINAKGTGQFERTLLVADEGATVSYLEGCTAPQRDENQLHAAVVELFAHKNATIKYSTIQNWYPGNEKGLGGIYNFVTKRGKCDGYGSKISWTQVETGSAITWKYPSCILRGDNSRGEFYSIAVSNGRQQIDSGTKMIHLGKNTSSRIISKGISAGKSNNTYRGQVSAHRKATNARNFTQCDSLLIGNNCGAHTVPYIEARNSTAQFEHEATTSKISEDQLFYCLQRGIPEEEAIALIVNGFVKEVIQELPMEFAVEAQKLIGISLEGSVG